MSKIVIIGLLIATITAVLFPPFASKSPDGLEKVAEDKGFLHKGEGQEVFSSPIPDYSVKGVKNENLSTSLAGLLGTLLTFGIAYGIGYFVKRKAQNGTRIH